jgi:hypothetical protein
LCFYHAEYDEYLQYFSLPEEQKKYTALPTEALVAAEIVLAVNEKIGLHKKLYEKAEFQDQGYRRQGKIGMQYMIHYTV